MKPKLTHKDVDLIFGTDEDLRAKLNAANKDAFLRWLRERAEFWQNGMGAPYVISSEILAKMTELGLR